jgi:HSP20 family protein
MKKHELKNTLDNTQLTLSSEKKNDVKEEKDNFTRREFSYQSFSRTFTIPEGLVNGEKIEAKYHDGVLSIKLPKRDEVKPKPARAIEIK